MSPTPKTPQTFKDARRIPGKFCSVPTLRQYYLARHVELLRFSLMKRLLSPLKPKEILIKNSVMYDNQFNNNKFTNHN